MRWNVIVGSDMDSRPQTKWLIKYNTHIHTHAHTFTPALAYIYKTNQVMKIAIHIYVCILCCARDSIELALRFCKSHEQV